MDNNNNYAGFWIRYFAQLIDGVIWSLNFFVSLYLLSAFGSANVNTFIPDLLWFLIYVVFVAGLIKFFLHPWLISKMGGGVGKLVCGLEIINQDSSCLTYKNALFREFIAKIASNGLLGLGYYWIMKTPQKQGWHDSLAGTYVIKKHNGFFTGLMILILFLAIDGGLIYKSFENFRSAKTLQYDIVTLITQIQQDFSKNTKHINNQSSTTTGTSDEAIIRGLVLENNLGCEMDAECYLTVSSEKDGPMRVIYHYGEMPPCTNTKIIPEAMKLKVGDKVEVLGNYTIDSRIKSLSTCNSKNYYIRTISSELNTNIDINYDDLKSTSNKHPEDLEKYKTQ
jgi:uncharacterized RDD family membrane protein YckC